MAPSPWLHICTERLITNSHFNTVCTCHCLIDTIRKVGTSNVEDASGCLGIFLTWCWCLHGYVCWCVRRSSHVFILFPQQKGPSYRFGVPVPSGGHLPWTLSRGHTSQASGLGTPMDPTLPVWKTKPHRYVPFRRKAVLDTGLNSDEPYWMVLPWYSTFLVLLLLCDDSKLYLQCYLSLKNQTPLDKGPILLVYVMTSTNFFHACFYELMCFVSLLYSGWDRILQ